ncbi:MAG: tRNA (N(6)-L-threonylcarbamoyladenosine(37)-C(2))-methylthiotransferase MtaB [Acetobacterales bacterium]
MKDSGPTLVTFGCRLNSYESEVMRGHLQGDGNDDLIVVNTCAVTAEAERQARQAIRRARRERPEARIVVTGCAAQVDPARWSAMPEVDRVVGNEEKLKADTWRAGERHARVAVNDIMSVHETAGHLVPGFEGRARAFVQVQQGCDHRCTFCIIPFGRGNNRSVPVGEVVAQVRTLVGGGYREVVLTGVDITDYGRDLPGTPTLGQLCRRLLALVPDLPRLRLSSLDPVEVDGDLLRLVADEPRLMPHFHLSVQAGDDMILKRMKRRHLRADVLAVCSEIRALRPDVAFGADLIAGFPTETEAMFANSLALVGDCGLTHLHVFPYSAREGTPAARMPQVPGDVRKERAQRLRERGASALRDFLAARVGGTAEVLVERDARGRSEHYAEVDRAGAAVAPGAIVRAAITGVSGDSLSGRLAA